jgi:drug/metabolite transporter (DMT)-like permease
VGELLALAAACCFAGANVTITRGAGANAQDNGAFLSILLTAALAGGIWIFSGLRNGWSELNATAMLWFAASGVLTIFIGRVFLFASVQHLGAVRASAVKRLNPVFSVLLGVLVLGESLDLQTMIGMILIFSGFGVLVKQSLAARASQNKSVEHKAAGSWKTALANLGFFYGPISGLAYATGYVARKQGLILTPDPAFGTMLGAVTGAIIFVLAAQFVDSYRNAMRAATTTFNPWLFAAGMLASIGQLLYFVALSHTTISRVALITSMEVFVTMFLSVALFRAKEQLTPATLLAAGLGVAGTVFMVA